MKKSILIFVSSLALAGCALPFVSRQQPATIAQPTPAPVEQFKTASTQIAKAFQTGQSLKCNLANLDGNEPNSHYLIKDKKMKIESDPSPESSTQFFSINDGETIYLWSSEAGTPAIKMSVAEVKKNSTSYDNQFQNFPDLTDEKTRKEIQNSGYTIDCQPAQIDDQEFLPPESLTFTNSTNLMKNLTQTETNDASTSAN